MASKYYDLNKINQANAQYNVIIGERSNGKTFAVLKQIIENYAKTGKQGAIIRRYADDFVGKRGQAMFSALVSADVVTKATGGEWTHIRYWSSRWYLARYDKDEKMVTQEEPFCYGFALSGMEHDKSTSYPDITTICFDEFLTRTMYLIDEFVLFMNVCSTIIRQRNDVKIYMLGNTVNKYCPYFAEMGLKHVKDQKQGTIDIYQYGESALKVAVEYCSPIAKKGKKSDVYFAFDNPKLSMITSGSWEIDIYPHCPCKYRPKDIVFTYFIEWDTDMLQCDIIALDNKMFTFVHLKTTPLKKPDKDLIFRAEYDPRPNHRRRLTKPTDQMGQKLLKFYNDDKVFYQDNSVGEIMRNYLNWSKVA